MTNVGVVVPCFDAGAVLREAIDSVRAQEHPGIRIVVCDDGSTDPETLDILHSLESEGLKVLRQENAGPGAARNTAIRYIDAEYILPLDADDRLLPRAVSACADVLDARPEIGIVAGASELIGEAEGHVRCTYTGIESMLDETTIPNISMFRRTDWEAVGGYPENIRTGEDWGFWMRVLGLGREVEVLDRALFEYRISEHQVTRRLDTVDVARARNVVMRDARDLYARHPDYLIEQLAQQRELLAHFRKRYGPIQERAARLKGLLARIRSRLG